MTSPAQRWFLPTVLLVIHAFVVNAAPEAVDRGPTFSGTIRARFPGENVTMKGVVVALGTETNAFICYDTDLMRVSLAWTGDYLSFGNYMKEISHPQPPEVAGTAVFGTTPGPGWARGGSFDDTRPNKQGPLPSEWAKYRGLYLHGRDVVFSYAVGKVPVLEMPGLEKSGAVQAFTRTIQLGKSSEPLTLLVAEQPGSTSLVASTIANIASHGDVEFPPQIGMVCRTERSLKPLMPYCPAPPPFWTER